MVRIDLYICQSLYTQSLWTESEVSVSVNLIPTVIDYTAPERNNTAISLSEQAPFYVGDGNIVFFNRSQLGEMDGNTTYELVIAASDNQTGAVTCVHSSVNVLKTLEAGVYLKPSYIMHCNDSTNECTERCNTVYCISHHIIL